MDKSVTKESSSSTQWKEDSKMHTHLTSDQCSIQCGGTAVKDNDDVHLIASDSNDKSRFAKIYRILITLTIEPIIFGFNFAYVMNQTVLLNMMMDKGCQFYFNYSKEVCNNISQYETEKESIEKLATSYSLYANLTTVIAALMMIFIAPWSDKYGRKIPLLVSVVGIVLTDIGIFLCAMYFESSLLYIVVSRLPAEFVGGFTCILTIVFSHASEVSSLENRTLKYTTVETALDLGGAFGGITGGFLLRHYSYVDVYVAVAAIHLLCCICILVIVEETTGLDVNMKWHEKAKDFFTCKSFKDGFVSTFRAREGNTRVLLILLLASMCTIILNYDALGAICYIYTHHVYNWDPAIFSMVASSAAFSGYIVTVVAVPLLVKKFKFRDFTLGIIGTLSMIATNLLIAFSKYHTPIYYTGLAAGVFTTLGCLAVRSGVSKLVEKEELGRVFAFLAVCQTILPMLGTVATTHLFNFAINIFPSVTYSVAAILLIFPLGTFIWALKNTETPFSERSVDVNDDSRENVS